MLLTHLAEIPTVTEQRRRTNELIANILAGLEPNASALLPIHGASIVIRSSTSTSTCCSD